MGYILGIDISKEKFDVSLLPEVPSDPTPAQRHTFANHAEGFTALCRWLTKHKVLSKVLSEEGPSSLHACMEATGNYGDALALFLHEQGYAVSVMNPFQIKSFANSELQRSSNDRTAAGVIARFCRSHPPALWQPPAPEMRQWTALVRRWEELETDLTRVKNQSQTPQRAPEVLFSLTRQQEFLQEEMKRIPEQLLSLMEKHPSVQERVRLLCTIPGIGQSTAIKLLAHLGDVTRFENTRQVAAYAGLVPTKHTSGSSVQSKPRLSKRGNPHLRKIMYLPALTATRFNPVLQQLYDRMKAAHRPKKVALGAVMHKLLKIAVAVLRNNTPFNPNHGACALAA